MSGPLVTTVERIRRKTLVCPRNLPPRTLRTSASGTRGRRAAARSASPPAATSAPRAQHDGPLATDAHNRTVAGEPALIVCNHRTRIDWMFIWCLCARSAAPRHPCRLSRAPAGRERSAVLHGCAPWSSRRASVSLLRHAWFGRVRRLGLLDTMKIALKESLKNVPGFGWAMQAFMFVFLARDKARDLQHMENVLLYHTANDHPLSLILFPEAPARPPARAPPARAAAPATPRR